MILRLSRWGIVAAGFHRCKLTLMGGLSLVGCSGDTMEVLVTVGGLTPEIRQLEALPIYGGSANERPRFHREPQDVRPEYSFSLRVSAKPSDYGYDAFPAVDDWPPFSVSVGGFDAAGCLLMTGTAWVRTSVPKAHTVFNLAVPISTLDSPVCNVSPFMILGAHFHTGGGCDAPDKGGTDRILTFDGWGFQAYGFPYANGSPLHGLYCVWSALHFDWYGEPDPFNCPPFCQKGVFPVGNLEFLIRGLDGQQATFRTLTTSIPER